MSYLTHVTDSTPMPFGRHKGTPVGSVPAVYLLLCYDRGYLKGGLKQYVLTHMAELQQERDNVLQYKQKHFKTYLK